jgi:hypothetical protein
MLDVATRESFLRWLEVNQDDLIDQISQKPRSIKLWASDFARAVKSATVEMGMDRGHAGIFADEDEEIGLHDPEAEDDEEGT